MKRIEWTPDNCNKLRGMYNTCDVADIAAYFGCSGNSIYRKAGKIGLKKENKMTGSRWSKEHDQIMFDLWPDKYEIARRVGRKVGTVVEHARKNALNMGFAPKPPHKWTPEEDAVLCELYPAIGRKQTALRMGIPEERIKRRAKKLELRASNNFWAESEISLLKEKFRTCDRDELAVIFHRPVYCVYSMAYKLGLLRGREHVSEASVKNWMRQSFRVRKQSDIVDDIIAANPSILRLKKAQIILARRLRETGYKPVKPEFWTSEKDAALVDMYHRCKLNDIVEKLNISRSAIWRRAKYLEQGRKKRIAV